MVASDTRQRKVIGRMKKRVISVRLIRAMREAQTFKADVSLFLFSVYTFKMPILRVPTLFKYYLNGQTEVTVTGQTVADTLTDLTRQYPAIQPHLFDSSGKVRRHINLFVNADNIRDLNGLETAVQEHDVVKILPSVTGG